MHEGSGYTGENGGDVAKLGARPARGGEKYQVVVHVDGETLKTGGPGRCELKQGSCLAIETAKLIACDASLVEIKEDEHGDVLDIRRKSRTIPPSIARALRARDRGCRFPGCTNRHFVDGQSSPSDSRCTCNDLMESRALICCIGATSMPTPSGRLKRSSFDSVLSTENPPS